MNTTRNEMVTVEAVRAEWLALVAEAGSDPVSEENAILSVGREFLPECARRVLVDRDDATVEYYEFLIRQTSEAQAEHDAEVAAGHEWSR